MLSKNAIALIVLVLSLLGLEVSDQSVIEVISAVGTVASFVLMVWNQLARKDVDNFLFKRK